MDRIEDRGRISRRIETNADNSELLEAALVHHRANRLMEAEPLYRQILAREPAHPLANYFLGVLALQCGEFDAAISLINQGLSRQPNIREAHYHLGCAWQGKGRLAEAIECFRKELAANPGHTQAQVNLAVAMVSAGQVADAVEILEAVLNQSPQLVEALTNLAVAYGKLGRLAESAAMLKRALEFDPQNADAHYNLGLLLLLQGDMPRGWKEYEWRFKANVPGHACAIADRAMWDGSALDGRTILIDCEQGFGDSIQFVRYLPMVKQRGGRVILRCQPELRRLFETVEGVERLLTTTEPAPEVDLFCPLLSLPFVFQTTLDTIPNAVPYVRAGQWKQTITGERKVGLCWAGGAPKLGRSIPLAMFERLAGIRDVRFYSLQKGPALEELRQSRLEIADVSGELHDFAETAALINALDLVITVDTAVAHLAGALGKPVWNLVQAVPDWRWMLGRNDSPWYPTMRLFRQSTEGDWAEVNLRVADALADYCSGAGV